MGKINYGRVILGGTAGGIVGCFIDVLVNVVLLGQQWRAAMRSLNRPNANFGALLVCLFLVWMIGGILVVWVYAAIRPRFGAGARTAVYAGLVPWVFGVLLVHMLQAAESLYSPRLMFYTTLVEIVPTVTAALVGAWLYKEDESIAVAYPAAAPQATR